ncbi:T9SS type A sorting domain-containing protein [Psychroflexus halocasei]|uniref:Por secretion system C-terminal sorting domain-containing protein n=1 Tax=Psychroflexus halocasei TaxID=908615 RepID=A0A1H4AHZ4_9FLAO|nr:T9SS type A sorting domain-containing protein [Psychroflexus halocasei]SEA35222.1 Por secretion system C-terminal sorting domain-containing protein [Psychroflexus halocasei]
MMYLEKIRVIASFVLPFIILVSTPNIISAQSTVNTSGGSNTLSIGAFDYSIGEMTVVSTQSNANITVTQGLLQVESSSLGTPEEILSDQDLTIYPNPTTDLLYIKPSLKGSGELSIKLYDLQGRRVSERTFYLETGLEKQKIDLSYLQEATYMLSVEFIHEQKNYRQTYKIVKSSL